MEILNIAVVILLVANAVVGAIRPNKFGHCLGWILALIYYLAIIGK